MKPVTPILFFDALIGYQRTAVIKAAIELDVFSHIATGSETLEALAEACDASQKGLRVLCDSLAILGLLEKEEGHYRLTAESSIYLDRGSPSYIGAVVEFITDATQLDCFAQFTEAVKRGGSAASPLGTLAPDHPLWGHFARSMTGLARPMAEFVAAEAGPVSRVLDVACGHGLYGIVIAESNADAEVTAVDWPRVLEVARRHARASGVEARFHTLAGSAFDVDFGVGYDVVILANFLQCLDADSCARILDRVRAAVKDDGRLFTVAFVPGSDRLHPATSGWFATAMLATTPGGDAYTKDEYDAMFSAAGFTPARAVDIPGSAERLLISHAVRPSAPQ